MSANLTDEELREAAAEAGISPQELRRALVARQQATLQSSNAGVPSRPGGPPPLAQVEGRLPMRPVDATSTLRHAIERQTGLRGHMQGPVTAHVVDEAKGLTYEIRSEGDGDSGALVRVSVDVTQGRASQALLVAGLAGMDLTLLLVSWLLGSWLVLGSATALAVMGTLYILSEGAKMRRNLRQAHANAAHALATVEDAGPLGVLPPPPPPAAKR